MNVRWQSAPSSRSDPSLQPPPGQMAIVMAGLVIGILLMGIQLWLLTVALDLYLAGKGREVWQLALLSGLIFLGGLAMLWLIGRRPQVRQGTRVEDNLVAPAPAARQRR
jgi:ABC-type multidrug transport system fused ATPase/permease subunit